MACYSPLHAYRGKLNENGKVSVVWRPGDSVRGERLDLPCGICLGCRLERARQWAVRCMHEASLYERNSFVTLTYDNAHLPYGGSLVLSDFQNFMKRLRERRREKVRFFHCGEYGSKLGRPHYHALLFGVDFPDKEVFSSAKGKTVYSSKELSSLWPSGFNTIGDVSFESAGYCARYALKKVLPDDAEKHYGGKLPEYCTMSRRPGIGRGWYEKWKGDVYPSDFLVVNGVRCRPPRFYDNLLDVEDSGLYDSIKEARVERVASLGEFENDSFRLPVKEAVRKARLALMSRPMEDGQ